MEPRVLTYDDTGEGEPLILVPGGLTGWLSWIPHQDPLSAHHRVIRVQPIHNELGSAGIPGDRGYDAEIERESLRLTLDELGIERADFAGWSRGGGALIEFTLAYPDRVRALALVEPAAEWVLEELGEDDMLADDETQAFVADLEGREVTEDDLARFLMFAGMVADPAEARDNPAWDRWMPHRAALSWPYQDIDPSRRSIESLRSITCPVLLVNGTETGPWQKRIVEALAEYLPDAKVIELNGGHASHIESIDEFLEALEAHIH